MKTNKLIAAALLPLLFSCAKENIAPADKNAAEGNYVTINLAPDSDAVTRATFDDSKGIIWQPGVKAGLIKMEKNWNPVESESLAEDKIYDYEDPKNDYKKSWQASFKFNMAESDYTGSYKFFYPYHSEAAYTGDYIRIPFWVAPNQSSGVGQSSEVFAVVSKDMVTLDPTNHDTGAVTYYKVVGSYIRFLVYGKAGEKVKSISIQSEQKPSGKYFVNGNTNELNNEAYTDDSELVTVSVNGDYSTPATKSEARGIYASVLPRTLKNTYTVVTDKGWYKFESQNEAEFKFGSIKDVSLNLENANCLYSAAPAELYIVGDACESGWDANNAVAMTKEGNIFTAELYLQKGAEGFKLLTRKGIFEYCYVNDGNGNMVYYNNPGDADKKFNVDGFALYKVTADFNTGKLTCEALAPYLVSDFTSYHFGSPDEPLQMKATDTPGVFKAEKVRIYNKPHLEGSETKYYTNAFKFAFKKSDGADIDYTFSIQPDNDKDFEIVMGKEFYTNGKAKVDALSQEFKTRLVGKLGKIGSLENNIDYKWLVKGTYNNKYYDITLDLVNNKLTLSLSQGSTYKLVGINNEWNSNAPSATVEGDVATWTLDVNTKTEGWDGTFKICGENTISQNSSDDSFWEGEWYYSQLNAEGAWWWTSEYYGSSTPVLIESSGDRKWKMTESGNYTFVFDTKKLTLKVTKNSQQMAL